MTSPIRPYLENARERMKKTLEHFVSESRGIRTGRATPGLVDSIRADYYGSKVPLNQIASVSVPDPRSLVVKPFDAGALKNIERAILASDLGFNPSIEGKMLRIAIPPLSEEQRKKLAARVKSMAEESRVSMRNIRRDVLKEIETAHRNKSGSTVITEDDLREGKEKIQDLLKEHEKKVEEALAGKQAEIMEV